ncbi:unnamed protein product [Caenorhabditis sp. 36 PRJEB53466]|nr:unnamed protein product [Caenorhabditis sp. 36 PRJEB53466]
MIRFAVSFLILVASTVAVSFSCPTAKITQTTIGGNLPVGTTVPVLVPANTNCTITFDIPKGFVLKIGLSADFQSTNDTVQVVDNLGVVRTLQHTGVPINNALIYVSASFAQIRVASMSGKSSFMATYLYQSLSGYTQVTRKTGEFIALSSVVGTTYYSFTSAKNDRIVATVGQRNTQSTDYVLNQIYVYDGANLTTANMIGRLDSLGTSISPSSGSAYSLVNFYGYRSTSYLLANDYSAVQNLNKYTVIVTSLGSTTNGQVMDLSNNGASYTFICTDCSKFYLTQFTFDSLKTVANKGYVTFQGQTPTHGRNKLIRYDAMTYTSKQLPQLIPTNIFTMGLYVSGINLMTSTVNDDTEWKRPYDGRKGFIFSPNLWDSTTTNYNYEFRNDSQLFKYQLNFDAAKFASVDSLSLKIGTTSSGTPAVNNLYPRDTSSTGVVSSNGNYMQLGFNGSVSSDVRLSFTMTQVSTASAIRLLVPIFLAFFRLL